METYRCSWADKSEFWELTIFFSKLCLHLVIWSISAFVVLLFFLVCNLLCAFSGRPDATTHSYDTHSLSCWATGRGSSSLTDIYSIHLYFYSNCYSQSCLSVLYRNPESDPQQATVAKKISLWTGKNLERDQANVASTLPLSAGPVKLSFCRVSHEINEMKESRCF